MTKKGMRKEYTFQKQTPPKPKAAGGLGSTKKQVVKSLGTKPGHRVPKAKRPPPFAKPKPRGL
jgi:hypothetical protein